MKKDYIINIAKKLFVWLFILVSILWISFCFSTRGIELSIKINVRSFALILWSILLEAFPFVLLGTIVSSLIQVFVSEDTILKILPKNKFLRLVFASCVGFIFPVCECAIIPITRGLIKKGMPIGPAIAFMVATPIVNPVVLLSTYNAFSTMPEMAIYRGVFGLFGAILIGLVAGLLEKEVVLKEEVQITCDCGQKHHHHDHSHHHRFQKEKLSIWKKVIAHTNAEFKSVGMYLIFGAMIATCMQMFVSKEILFSLGNGRIGSILVMMILAFILSLCSEADAFIASTFLLHFTSASVLAFLITGPMIDIKNTMMLFGSFKNKFVIKLIGTILTVCFGLAIIASLIMEGIYA